MKTEVLNGKDVRSGVNPKDTIKGVAALATATAKEVLSPLQERLKKISEVQKLSNRRKGLIDAQDKLTNFEEGLTGDNESISLESGRNSIDITKPEALRRVVDFLKADVRTTLAEVDNQLLAATL